MDKYKSIKISDFTYDLPDERIARYPLENRDQSKLLVWEKGTITESRFDDCNRFLPEESLLVFNNTRVIHARLFFRKETGAKIEIFCLEPVDPADHQLAFQTKKSVRWKCMVGNSKKWKSGYLERVIPVDNKQVLLRAEKIKQEGNSFIIEFSWNHEVTFSQLIELCGTLPIPPYLNRDTEEGDEESYQTVYAKIDGSVAAPTAGLHFTQDVLDKLRQKNILTREITLHVGAGTFQPVKSDTIAGHSMHNEMVIISKNVLKDLINHQKKTIAVGTTSVRSLESLYWLGMQMAKGQFDPDFPEVKQWTPYETQPELEAAVALEEIVRFLENNQKDFIQFSTQIIILPGYNFKIIDGLFTNFHQPQSTLLLLIAAILGDDWQRVYNHALSEDYRFLSYGDSNLYLR